MVIEKVGLFLARTTIRIRLKFGCECGISLQSNFQVIPTANEGV